MSIHTDQQHIIPFLWFDGQAKLAIETYVNIFPNSEIINLRHWVEGSGFPTEWLSGGIFVIDGLKVHAFDAGPQFKFNESISFFVNCKSQEEVDFYWEKLLENGGIESQCGWLKDRFGLSWQIVPEYLKEKMASNEPERVAKMMKAMMKMIKLDIATLKAAYES